MSPDDDFEPEELEDEIDDIDEDDLDDLVDDDDDDVDDEPEADLDDNRLDDDDEYEEPTLPKKKGSDTEDDDATDAEEVRRDKEAADAIAFRDFGIMHLFGDLFQVYETRFLPFLRHGERKSEARYFFAIREASGSGRPLSRQTFLALYRWLRAGSHCSQSLPFSTCDLDSNEMICNLL